MRLARDGDIGQPTATRVDSLNFDGDVPQGNGRDLRCNILPSTPLVSRYSNCQQKYDNNSEDDDDGGGGVFGGRIEAVTHSDKLLAFCPSKDDDSSFNLTTRSPNNDVSRSPARQLYGCYDWQRREENKLMRSSSL